MKFYSLIFLFVFTMCKSSPTPKNDFEGYFKGQQTGIASTAELTVADNQLKGKIIMNGKTATVSGTINNKSASGFVNDTETGKQYVHTSFIKGDELRFSITFPELDNRIIELIMERQKTTAGNTAMANNTAHDRNPALVGVWKNTEVLGGGSDGMSFSTEHFMELSEDGSARSWTGRSAGSEAYADGNEAGADKGEWYTEGKTLYLRDAVTKQDATTFYSVDATKMLLHNGGSEKRIFVRIQ